MCTPLLLPAFPAIIATTGTSVPGLVCEGLLLLTGAPLNGSVSTLRNMEEDFVSPTHSTFASSPRFEHSLRFVIFEL